MSKLGPHFIGTPGFGRWLEARPVVYKFDPSSLGAAAQVPPGPLVVGKLDQREDRLNVTDWKVYHNRLWQPEAAAQFRFMAQTNVHAGANKPSVNRYTANSRIDVWEYDNEVVPDNPQEAQWFAAYSIEMMKLFEGIGRRYALFNFAVGTPDIKPGEAADIWPYLLPAVAHAHANGHYVALHEYMGYEADFGVGWRQIDARRQPLRYWHGRLLANGQPDQTYPYGWTVLRYRYLYDTYFKPAGLGDVKLLITECGCDSVETVTPLGISTGTWKEHAPHWAAAGKDPETHYAAMLAWYDKFLTEDPYVAGAVVFTVGSVGGWANWDISGTRAETHLLHHIETTAAEPPPPPAKDEEMSFNTRIWKHSVAIQLHEVAGSYGLQLNPQAGIQRRIVADGGAGLQIVTEEFYFENHVAQVAEDAKTGDRFLYYAPTAQRDRITKLYGKGATYGGVAVGADPPPAPAASPLDGLLLGHLFAVRYALTSPFNAPRKYGNQLHEGADYDIIGGTADNKVDVLCAYEGVVDMSLDSTGGYGKYVRVRHSRNGRPFYTRYAHLDRRYVQVGQTVSKGQPLGEVGATGNANGEHVHFNLEVPGFGLRGYVVDYVVNPEPYMPGGRNTLPPYGSPAAESVDVLPYLRGLHRVQFDQEYIINGKGGTQTTQVWHLGANDWLYIKGEAGEYERLGLRMWQGQEWIYRFEDTSESDTRFYAHYISEGGMIGAPWFPRFAEVGKWYETTKFVQHYLKAGCVKQNSGRVTDRLRLLDLPRIKTYAESGRTLLSVITLEWGGGEQYDLAEGRGNVGFRDATRNFWFMGDLAGRADRAFSKPVCLNVGW